MFVPYRLAGRSLGRLAVRLEGTTRLGSILFVIHALIHTQHILLIKTTTTHFQSNDNLISSQRSNSLTAPLSTLTIHPYTPSSRNFITHPQYRCGPSIFAIE